MIVATAGHVDHGKTALVKQLTGVDTDRLEEEKQRGLSISLGYAYLARGEDTPIGFIDVPGHHRFINNMISGISGIDLGLLVVAADDGPMPQTREHLDVLRVLGVDELVTVISKIDRVEEQRGDEVEAEIVALLEEKGWDAPGLFRVSNTTGTGIDALRSHLLARGERQADNRIVGSFRLSIDRAFTIKGAGVVVTGTVSAGQVRVGDNLCLQPGGIETRVRGLRVHDREAETARRGQRCALNLGGGIEVADITRGDWLLAPGTGAPSRRVDVSFTLLSDAPFSLKHLAPVKLYLGAGRIAGRIAFLKIDQDDKRLHPGAGCLAQLVLDEEVPCYTGQRFLMRDHAENVLLGGGHVLDPQGRADKKSSPARVNCLQAMAESSPASALATIVGQGRLVDLSRFRLACNLADADELPLPEAHTVSFSNDGRDWLVRLDRWQQVRDAVLGRVKDWHREHPHEVGIKANAMKGDVGSAVETPLLTGVISSLLSGGMLALSEGRIRIAGFSPAVHEGREATWQAVQSCLTRHGKRVPLLSELSAETGISVQEFEQVARDALKDCRLFRVSAKRYALPAQLLALSRDVLDLDGAGEPLSVVALKGSWGVGRNLAVEILEYFDSIRFTRREGNVRVVMDAEVPGRLFNA